MRINERKYLVNVTESDLKELETSPETFWEGVEGIGESAFSGLKGLKSIVIPASVKFIGEQAFYGCSKLTEVHVLGGETIKNRAFANCGKLETIEFGDNVVNIGQWVCEDCPKLSRVTIGEKVEQIGQYAFVGCKKLQQLENNSKNLKIIGRHAFEGCDLAHVVIPGSVEIIEENVFASNKNMQSVKIEEGVKTVQCYAFAHCDLFSIKNYIIGERYVKRN